MAKVQISIDDDLLERIDKYADANYMSRSGMITLSTNQFLNQNEALLVMREMALLLRKINETGNLDDVSREQLNDMERFFKVVNGQ